MILHSAIAYCRMLMTLRCILAKGFYVCKRGGMCNALRCFEATTIFGCKSAGLYGFHLFIEAFFPINAPCFKRPLNVVKCRSLLAYGSPLPL